MKNIKTHPNLYIIAGPNGAGKTTFAEEFLPHYVRCRIFVNADTIARGLAAFSPDTAALKAGRLLLEQIQLLARKKADFGFETTLSGVTYASFFRKLKNMGYLIHLYFLWIPSVNLSLARIEERVKRGGHHIPEKVVRRRFHKGLRNLFSLYRPLLDSWTIFDNSRTIPYLIAEEKKESLSVRDVDLFQKIVREGIE